MRAVVELGCSCPSRRCSAISGQCAPRSLASFVIHGRPWSGDQPSTLLWDTGLLSSCWRVVINRAFGVHVSSRRDVDRVLRWRSQHSHSFIFSAHGTLHGVRSPVSWLPAASGIYSLPSVNGGSIAFARAVALSSIDGVARRMHRRHVSVLY